jgi:methylenetetrahydrofolate reductase (NADPH)
MFPLYPVLKPIYNRKQLTDVAQGFHIDLPAPLSNEIMKCKSDEEVEKVGRDWLLYQSQELKKFGVPVLHYYTLGKPHLVADVVRSL